MKKNLSAPCNECPFKKTSLPGYLGGVWNVSDLHLFVSHDKHFPCHKSMENNTEENYSHCVGSIMYLNQNKSMSKNKDIRELQLKFKDEDHSNILNLFEFAKHHKKAK